MLNFEEFKKQIMEDLKFALPERLGELTMEPVNIKKLQNASYDGISIRREGEKIGMNLDLTGGYRDYVKDNDYNSILSSMVRIVTNALDNAPRIDIDKLLDYEAMKNYLTVQVVPTASNEEMLKNIPHRQLEDLSIVYRFVISQDEDGQQSILVTNDLMEKYGIDAAKLHEDAMENAPVYKPVRIRPMTEVLAEMMGEEFAEAMGIGRNDSEDFMYVATTPGGNFGAGVITYPEFMDQAADRVGGDFYMLPSSLHEVLLVPDRGSMNVRELEEMVRDVNATQVSEQDRLSDRVYHYDSKEHVFELAEAYEKRILEKGHDIEASAIKNLKDKVKHASKDEKPLAADRSKDNGEVL